VEGGPTPESATSSMPTLMSNQGHEEPGQAHSSVGSSATAGASSTGQDAQPSSSIKAGQLLHKKWHDPFLPPEPQLLVRGRSVPSARCGMCVCVLVHMFVHMFARARTSVCVCVCVCVCAARTQ